MDKKDLTYNDRLGEWIPRKKENLIVQNPHKSGKNENVDKIIEAKESKKIQAKESKKIQDEKLIEAWTRAGLDVLKNDWWENKGYKTDFTIEIGEEALFATIFLKSGKEKKLGVKESYEFFKATDTEKTKIIEGVNFKDKLINGGDENKKMLPPKESRYIASKQSFDDLPTHIAPKHDPEIEKIKHLIRRIVVKCTGLKNINLDDFSFGNLDLFLKDNPKEIIKANGVHIFSEVLGRSVLLESRPCILSTHAVAKMLFPDIKKLSTIHYNHVLKLFVNNPILKNPYWTEIEHKELGSLKFSSHLLEVLIHKVKGKKYLIFYPNVSFFQGLLVNNQRILQSVDGEIVGEIEKKCLSLLGRKNKDIYVAHLALTLFNHLIQINHLTKTHEKYPLNLDWFITRNCFSKRLFNKKGNYYGKMSQRVNAAFNAFKHFKIIQNFEYKKGPRAYEDSWIIETQNNQNLFNVKQESSTRLIR